MPAVARGDPGQAGLHAAQGHLVAPVEALLVAALAPAEADLAADVADALLPKPGDQARERIRVPEAVGVRERDDRGLRLAHRLVQRRHLAAAGQVQHQVGAGGPRELDGAVAGAVGGDHDPQQLGRVVQGQRVRDLALDHPLLVVGGDDQVDLDGLDVRRPSAKGVAGVEQRRQRPQDQGVADVRVDDQRHREPEDDFERHWQELSKQAPVQRCRVAADPIPRVAALRGGSAPRPRGARARPDRPAARRRAEARAAGSSGGTVRAAPWAATSGKPPTALSTSGRPKASAV